MQDDQPHALQYALVDTLNDFVFDFVMCAMAPPDQDIRTVDHLFSQAMFRIIEGRQPDCQIIRVDAVGNGFVQTLRVKLFNNLIHLLMPEFVPYRYSYFRNHVVLL